MTATKKRLHERRPHPVLEATYAAVAADLGWSPADLDAPLDLDAFIASSYTQADARADTR